MLIPLLIIISCEKNTDNIIDPNYAAPILSNVYKSKDTIWTTSFNPSIQLNTSLDVNANGGSAISSVKCKIYDSGNNLLNEITLLDNGILPDSVPGDLRYSCSVNITNISCLLVGSYSIVYTAVNQDGISGNVINSSFLVKNSMNFPPTLSNPVIPDSIVRPVSVPFLLTLQITATDTNGVCDVNQVYFDTYRPSGSYLGRNPMTYSNSSVWTFSNFVTPAVPDSVYGYYKYFFYAIDNSNAISLVYKDSIKFVRP